MNHFISVLIILEIFSISLTSAQWGYSASNGPDTWQNTYPLCGNGMQQSPIDIQTSTATVNYTLIPFPRSLFSMHPQSMTIVNNGHTIQVNLGGGYTINNNRLLPAEFRAAQFHFHWGSPGNQDGSEHTMNGMQYFGELHIVHYNTRYANLTAAAAQSDGLAVLGFFIQDDYPQDNLAFNRLLSLVTNGSVAFEDDSFMYDELFSIETLLPPCLDTYYRYPGSLTTPGCFESVTWTVFDSIIQISRRQAQVLETMVYENLQSEPDVELVGNFRPPQPLNGRTVYRSPPCDRSSSSALKPAFLILTLMMTIIGAVFCH